MLKLLAYRILQPHAIIIKVFLKTTTQMFLVPIDIAIATAAPMLLTISTTLLTEALSCNQRWPVDKDEVSLEVVVRVQEELLAAVVTGTLNKFEEVERVLDTSNCIHHVTHNLHAQTSLGQCAICAKCNADIGLWLHYAQRTEAASSLLPQEYLLTKTSPVEHTLLLVSLDLTAIQVAACSLAYATAGAEPCHKSCCIASNALCV